MAALGNGPPRLSLPQSEIGTCKSRVQLIFHEPSYNFILLLINIVLATFHGKKNIITNIQDLELLSSLSNK